MASQALRTVLALALAVVPGFAAPPSAQALSTPLTAAVTDPAVAKALAAAFGRLDAVEGRLGEVEAELREAKAALEMHERRANTTTGGQPPPRSLNQDTFEEDQLKRSPCNATTIAHHGTAEDAADVGEEPPGSGKEARHRHLQQSKGPCSISSQVMARSSAVMKVCCGKGGGHRRLQVQCAKLPTTCGTVACADEFMPFFNDCASILQHDRRKYQVFFRSCHELKAQSGRMLMQPVAVQMFKVAITTAAPPPSGVPPTPSPSTNVQQYHAVCNSRAMEACVPACNATTHGYELLATVDGTDTTSVLLFASYTSLLVTPLLDMRALPVQLRLQPGAQAVQLERQGGGWRLHRRRCVGLCFLGSVQCGRCVPLDVAS